MLAFLLVQGADPGLVTRNGETLLMHLARRGQDQLFKALIGRTGSLADRSQAGVNLLMCAVEGGNLGVRDLVLAQGLDPFETDGKGNTLVHYAALNDHPDMLRWVLSLGLEAGADLQRHGYKNKQGCE